MTTKTLRWLLILTLLTAQVAAAIVVLLAMQNRTTEQLTDNAQLNLERLGHSVAQQADQFIAPALAGLSVGHRLVADGILDPARVRHLEDYFLAKLQAHPTIAGMYVGRDDGSFMMTTRNERGVLSALIESYGGLRSVLMTQRDQELEYLRTWVDPQNSFNPTERPWYIAAKKKPGISVTSPYRFFRSGVPGVTASISLQYPDGSHAGVLGVDIDLRALSGLVADSLNSSHANASAIIIDQNAHVLAASDPSKLTAISQATVMPSFTSIANEALQALHQRFEAEKAPANFAGDHLNATSSEVEWFRVGKQFNMGLVKGIPLAGGLIDWTLLVQMPASEYLGGIKQLFDAKLKTILAVLAVTVIIALLGYFGLSDAPYRAQHGPGLDPLTGALTRSEFERRMHGMLNSRRETENDSRIYLVALDLDGFKALNDNFGESGGDMILSAFVARLTSKMRDSDLIGRNGGDEFVLAVRLDRDVDPLSTIERIRQDVIRDGFRTKAGVHQLGFTAGIACFDPAESLDSLISRANQALVTGKARVRNRCYMAPDHHARWPETVVSALSARDSQRKVVKPSPAQSHE